MLMANWYSASICFRFRFGFDTRIEIWIQINISDSFCSDMQIFKNELEWSEYINLWNIICLWQIDIHVLICFSIRFGFDTRIEIWIQINISYSFCSAVQIFKNEMERSKYMINEISYARGELISWVDRILILNEILDSNLVSDNFVLACRYSKFIRKHQPNKYQRYHMLMANWYHSWILFRLR